MLEDQGKTLIDFFQSWKETIPIGIFEPLTLHITAQTTVLTAETTPRFKMPWMKFIIFVDGGSDPVYMRVNDKEIQTHTPLNAGDQLTVDMIKPIIERVTLVCLPGQTATVRIFARK